MRELFPILLTLCILVVGFGIWYVGRNDGWYINKEMADINICLQDSDKVCIDWIYPGYGVHGWSSRRIEDSTLHVSFNISKKSRRHTITMDIDTAKIKYIEIYGRIFTQKDIPVCK